MPVEPADAGSDPLPAGIRTRAQRRCTNRADAGNPPAGRSWAPGTEARLRRARDAARSIGIRVDLPFEQDVSPFVEQAYEHRTFFSRLQHVVIAGGVRRLVLEAPAVPSTRSARSSPLALGVRGTKDGARARELVAHLRRMNPLVRVCGGELTGHGRVDAARGPARLRLTAHGDPRTAA